ncbi:MAG: hydrogenase maturation protease [Anaerolineales bacterium]
MKNKLTSMPRLAVVGIGNELCADDAVGMLIARALLSHLTVQTSKTLMVIPAGVAVENVTGQLRGFAPDMILLIDAAELGEAPGTVRWLTMDAVTGVSALTHSLPLTMVMHYLNSELGCPVALLGIQIKSNEMGVEMCPEVHSAAEEILAGWIEMVEKDL